MILGGVETTVRIAHFRLAHRRQRFIRAYLRESQEMLLDAFNHALGARLLIDENYAIISKNLPSHQCHEPASSTQFISQFG